MYRVFRFYIHKQSLSPGHNTTSGIDESDGRTWTVGLNNAIMPDITPWRQHDIILLSVPYRQMCSSNRIDSHFRGGATHKNRQHPTNGYIVSVSPCLKAEAIKLCTQGILFRKIRGLKGNMSLKNMSRTEVVFVKSVLPYKIGGIRGGVKGVWGRTEDIPNLFKGVLFYYQTVKADLCKRYVFARSCCRNG